ncbi:hypothetical protein DAPPUDRAFT_333007 [Daphnia pulex]|uniref:Uncharacterized protein n=1 Tax=Daphnia pulex TaxID=6669 RepID=E9HRJ1_DAPPU|nr:hypothetical protein DAPPUDRAFT_332994 [Daphnia pulex]EFX65632.1 hypothetical protein DAPPUDRAFT_333007 [Daphnia pulex]|eukprot:EFX65620.1 hypothetical protein DAPPUDRAFT_332994 [Daphnia pulex]
MMMKAQDKADKEQVAITDCYLEGIVSFQDFMTRVENSDGSESGMEDSSDTDDEEKVPERNSNDPEYFPEESSKVQAQQKLKSSEHKGSGALPKAKGNVGMMAAVLRVFHSNHLHPQ